MKPFHVPKRRALVEVTLTDGVSLRVAIFLAEHAENHPGPERLTDWLHATEPFLPATDIGTGETVWLQREALAQVRAPAEIDHDEVLGSTLPTEQEVIVHLVDRTSISGLISYVLPDRASRLTDFLNRPPPFLRLLCGRELVFVNRKHVTRVTLKEA